MNERLYTVRLCQPDWFGRRFCVVKQKRIVARYRDKCSANRRAKSMNEKAA